MKAAEEETSPSWKSSDVTQSLPAALAFLTSQAALNAAGGMNAKVDSAADLSVTTEEQQSNAWNASAISWDSSCAQLSRRPEVQPTRNPKLKRNLPEGTAMLKSLYPNPCVAVEAYTQLIDILKTLPQDGDKRAAMLVNNLTVFSDSGLTLRGWSDLLHNCRVDGTRHTILQRVFRGGMVGTARALASAYMFTRDQYLFMRDAHRESLLHLAVRADCHELIKYLGLILHDDIGHLISGPYSHNAVGESPWALAHRLCSRKCIHILGRLYRVYGDSQLPLPWGALPISKGNDEMLAAEPEAWHPPGISWRGQTRGGAAPPSAGVPASLGLAGLDVANDIFYDRDA